MNVSIINLKQITKNIYKLIFIIIVLFLIKLLFTQMDLFQKVFTFNRCSFVFTSFFSYTNEQIGEIGSIDIININNPVLAYINKKEIPKPVEAEKIENTNEDEIIIPVIANVEAVTEKNIEESYNYIYDTVKIKNQSNYTMTDDLFNIEDINLSNKKVIIYHTHTCESYTPSEKYNYTMTGNYRTTDLNYSVARVGEELKKQLTNKGFDVIHNTTYHDYPSYNGSYDRSFNTAQNIIKDNTDADIIIDIHRDAVGDGSWYGPTVKIDSQSVAQMMFVIRYRWRWVRSS